MGSLSNVAPVFDHINMDKLVRHLTSIVGVPQKILKPQSELDAERQAQAQQIEQQQQLQNIQQVAEAGGKIAPLAKALPEEAKVVANADAE